MRRIRYIIGLLVLLFVVGTTACHYQVTSSSNRANQDTVIDGDSIVMSGVMEKDSLDVPIRPYALNCNLEVVTDTLWLHLLPFTDTIPVLRHDNVVVAEIDIHPNDSVNTVWVKVARDQSTIGWIPEKKLLKNVVPVDPISQCIHLFSSSHALPFFLILAVFFLSFVYRAVRRKQIKLIWLNDIDSVFPVILSLLMASSATLYNSIQHFVPETWEHYYYDPTLNPFAVPFILGLFIISVALILLLGVAMLDDLFHQTSIEVAFFYLVGLMSVCIFIYIFFTYIWVYLAYICLVAYAVGCVRWFRKANGYPYACGACGAKMRTKGVCPHCGALNE